MPPTEAPTERSLADRPDGVSFLLLALFGLALALIFLASFFSGAGPGAEVYFGFVLATWAVLFFAAIGRRHMRRGGIWRLALVSPLCFFGPVVLALFLVRGKVRSGIRADLRAARDWSALSVSSPDRAHATASRELASPEEPVPIQTPAADRADALAFLLLTLFGLALALIFLVSFFDGAGLRAEIYFGVVFATWAVLFSAAVGRAKTLRVGIRRIAMVSPLCFTGPALLAPFLLSGEVRRGFRADLRAARHGRPGPDGGNSQLVEVVRCASLEEARHWAVELQGQGMTTELGARELDTEDAERAEWIVRVEPGDFERAFAYLASTGFPLRLVLGRGQHEFALPPEEPVLFPEEDERWSATERMLVPVLTLVVFVMVLGEVLLMVVAMLIAFFIWPFFLLPRLFAAGSHRAEHARFVKLLAAEGVTELPPHEQSRRDRLRGKEGYVITDRRLIAYDQPCVNLIDRSKIVRLDVSRVKSGGDSTTDAVSVLASGWKREERFPVAQVRRAVDHPELVLLPAAAAQEAMVIAVRAASTTSQKQLAKELKAERALGLVWSTDDLKAFLKNPAYRQGQAALSAL